MKAAHTARHSQYPGEFIVEDEQGEMIATLGPTGVGGDEFFRVYWYGGTLHGKIDITEGGLTGAMEHIGEKYRK